MATKNKKATVENTAAEEIPAESQAEAVKKPQSKRSSSTKKDVIEVKAKEPVKKAVKEKTAAKNKAKKAAPKTAKPAAKKAAAKTTTSRKSAVKAEKTSMLDVAEDSMEAEELKPTAGSTEAGNPRPTATLNPSGKEDKQKAAPREQQVESARSDRGALILGGGMLFMGILLLSGRLLGIPFGMFLWPFIFIVPGALIFLTALSTENSSGEGLSILGGILTMLGCVFLAQSTIGLWASWAYAWALVAPTSIGISQVVYGTRKGRDAIVQSGNRLINIGLTIFAIGFAFFELVLGVSGFGLARLGLPVFPMMLILAGLVIVIRSFTKSRR